MTLKQDKLALKRHTVENKLSKTNLTAERRTELEARLEVIIAKEIIVDEKLVKLEKRSKKLETKLEKLEGQYSLVMEASVEATAADQPPL